MSEITDETERPALRMIVALPGEPRSRARSSVCRSSVAHSSVVQAVGVRSTKAPVPPTLIVSNVEATADYYVSVLGFALDASSFDPPHCATVVRWGRTLLIGQGTAGRESIPLLCAVDDVQALHCELQSNGASIVLSPQLIDGNWSAFDIADCDGHRVRFIQFTRPGLHLWPTPAGQGRARAA